MKGISKGKLVKGTALTAALGTIASAIGVPSALYEQSKEQIEDLKKLNETLIEPEVVAVQVSEAQSKGFNSGFAEGTAEVKDWEDITRELLLDSEERRQDFERILKRRDLEEEHNDNKYQRLLESFKILMEGLGELEEKDDEITVLKATVDQFSEALDDYQGKEEEGTRLKEDLNELLEDQYEINESLSEGILDLLEKLDAKTKSLQDINVDYADLSKRYSELLQFMAKSNKETNPWLRTEGCQGNKDRDEYAKTCYDKDGTATGIIAKETTEKGKLLKAEYEKSLSHSPRQ